jgi:hypothetical protein
MFTINIPKNGEIYPKIIDISHLITVSYLKYHLLILNQLTSLKLLVMKNEPSSIDCIDKKYKKISLSIAFLLVVSAITFIIIQFNITGKTSEILFISLTLFESLFILFAGLLMIGYIRNKGTDLYTSFDYFKEPIDPKLEINKLVCIFQHYRKYWALILIWALSMGLLPSLKKYWHGYFSLNIFFGIFLFFTNIITSYFVILIILFFIRVRNLWTLVKVELWNRENPAAKFIFSVSKRIALIGAIYMTSSLTAWNTSQTITPFGSEIILFFIFSILLLVSSIIIPLLPFINSIISLKNKALCEIDSKIQSEYLILVDSYDKKGPSVEFDKMNELVEMRKKIEAIHSFPFQLNTIFTSLSIVTISLIPKIIEIVLTNLIS